MLTIISIPLTERMLAMKNDGFEFPYQGDDMHSQLTADEGTRVTA